jgi:hypothetical protein
MPTSITYQCYEFVANVKLSFGRHYCGFTLPKMLIPTELPQLSIQQFRFNLVEKKYLLNVKLIIMVSKSIDGCVLYLKKKNK